MFIVAYSYKKGFCYFNAEALFMVTFILVMHYPESFILYNILLQNILIFTVPSKKFIFPHLCKFLLFIIYIIHLLYNIINLNFKMMI